MVRQSLSGQAPLCLADDWRLVSDTTRRRGVVVSGVRRMNEVNARRVRLLPGWVTVFGRVHHLGMEQAN